jgi:hypothetical protein
MSNAMTDRATGSNTRMKVKSQGAVGDFTAAANSLQYDLYAGTSSTTK